AGNLLPLVVPSIGRCEHVCADAGARCRILQTLDELGVAAVVRPRRNESGEVVEPCGVGVSVRGDVESLRPGGVDFRNDFRHVSPAWFAADFQMPNFHGAACFATDAQCLVYSCQNTGPLIALMLSVKAYDAANFA